MQLHRQCNIQAPPHVYVVDRIVRTTFHRVDVPCYQRLGDRKAHLRRRSNVRWSKRTSTRFGDMSPKIRPVTTIWK